MKRNGQRGPAGYAGNIKNTGSQVVEAPFKQSSNKGGGSVKKGRDLRSGK